MSDTSRSTPDTQPPQKQTPQHWLSHTNRRRLFLLSLVIVVPLGLLAIIAGLVFESKPLVVDTSVPTVESALRAKNLAKAVLDTLNNQRENAVISASEDDLNALMTLVRRGAPRVSGRAIVKPWLVIIQTSIRLPANPLGHYLNLVGEFLPDQQGLNINKVKIGKLTLPHFLSHALLRGALYFGMDNDEGTALFRSIQSLTLNGTVATVHLRSVPQLKERLKNLHLSFAKLRELSRWGNSPWDSAQVSSYYRYLLEIGRNLPASSPTSLAAYLGPLFSMARDRSVSGDPVQENRAALMALAIHLGSRRFDKLAGIRLEPALTSASSSPHHQSAQLGGREDLRLHFIISVGLKLLSDQGVSSAIGEFKELLDANRGGSGFSFADLAADRAGIRLATLAIDPEWGARHLQQVLAGQSAEQLFFPSVTDLPEDMAKAEFEQHYKGVDGKPYDELVREIDRRIEQCQAYAKPTT